MTVHHLDRTEARRIAVRAQLLDANRPTDLLAAIRHLTFLQLDPTAAVAPSADLVAWSRLGSAYRPAELRQALDVDRTLWEHDAYVRPMENLAIHLADMRSWPTRKGAQEWLAANDRFRRDVLERIGASGPLLSREIPDTSQVPWPSSGWTNNRNVTQMLEFLMMRGEVAISGRQVKQRLWDLPERVFPATQEVPAEEAERIRGEKRLRSLGIVRERAPVSPGDPLDVSGAGEPAVVEGVRGTWRVDPAQLGQPFTGRTALLSPFDRLVHDRVRLAALFEYEYLLEMYKPKHKRRWGYFALPILHNDRLVGKADVTADRKTGQLRVDAIHEDVPFTKAMIKGVRGELDDLATWLGLTVTGWPRGRKSELTRSAIR